MTTMMGFRIPPEAKKKLEEIAEHQHRPLANLVRAIVLSWLHRFEDNPGEALGYLGKNYNESRE